MKSKPQNGDELPVRNSTAEFLIFAKDAGADTISVRFQDEMLWLTQPLICQLFDVSKATVSEHLSNIFASGELLPEATVRKFRTVRQEGSRQVERQLEYYNLEAIIVRQELEYKSDFDLQLDWIEEQAKKSKGK